MYVFLASYSLGFREVATGTFPPGHPRPKTRLAPRIVCAKQAAQRRIGCPYHSTRDTLNTLNRRPKLRHAMVTRAAIWKVWNIPSVTAVASRLQREKYARGCGSGLRSGIWHLMAIFSSFRLHSGPSLAGLGDGLLG